MVQKEEKPRRGRPRAYDPESALSQATDAFWLSGYSGTSLDMLSASTGMNRPSLYGAFGDKRALYLATLDRYTSQSRELMERALDSDRPLPEVLQSFYDSAIAFYAPEKEAARGCFLIGTAATESMSDPEIRAKLGDALRQFDRVLEARFRRAIAEDEMDAAADPAALAKMASAIMHTLAVRSRAGDSRASLKAIAATGIRMICGDMPVRGAQTSRRARAKR